MTDQNLASKVRSALFTQQACIFGLVLLAVTFAAYSSVLPAEYIWDDDDYILNNPTLRTAGGLWRIWFEFGAVPQYYPLVHSTFWLEYQLWGLHPTGYHIVNLVLHTGAAFMLGAIIDRHFQQNRLQGWLSPGKIAALLFALHPVTVESAAWITERKNVLSLMLALTAAYHYLSWRATRETWRYVSAILLFAAALLSKTVACSLPAVLLVFSWVETGRLRKKDWLPTTPMFALGISLAFVTIWMEKHHVGASGAEWHFTALERVAIAGKSCWFYLSKILLPANLSFVYPRWHVGASILDLLPAITWLLLGMTLYFTRKIIGRGAVGIWIAYSGILLPALGFIDVYPFRYSFVADHFQYHAATITIAAIAIQIGKMPHKHRVILAIVLCLPYAAITWHHGRAFYNEETLWTATIQTNPNAWIAHNNLGIIQLSKKQLVEAEASFRRAIELKPDHGNAWTNLGMSLDLQGKTNKAENAFANATRILPNRPDMWRVVAQFYARHDRHEDALKAWRETLLRIPSDHAAAIGAAQALRGLGHPEQADLLLKQYEAAQ